MFASAMRKAANCFIFGNSFRALAPALALVGCGAEPLAQQEPQRRALPAAAWAICDAINTPLVLVLTRPPEARTATLTAIDKIAGAATFSSPLTYAQTTNRRPGVPLLFSLSDGEGSLTLHEVSALETPGSAYTPPLERIVWRGAEAQCRWIPRTRLLGITGKRTFVVYEDADGDLIYSAFDFMAAPTAPAIELSENTRSTTFSAEVRGGEELINPEAVLFTFAAVQGYQYRVGVDAAGARLEIWRDGAIAQTEPILAYQLGQAQEL